MSREPRRICDTCRHFIQGHQQRIEGVSRMYPDPKCTLTDRWTRHDRTCGNWEGVDWGSLKKGGQDDE